MAANFYLDSSVAMRLFSVFHSTNNAAKKDEIEAKVKIAELEKQLSLENSKLKKIRNSMYAGVGAEIPASSSATKTENQEENSNSQEWVLA